MLYLACSMSPRPGYVPSPLDIPIRPTRAPHALNITPSPRRIPLPSFFIPLRPTRDPPLLDIPQRPTRAQSISIPLDRGQWHPPSMLPPAIHGVFFVLGKKWEGVGYHEQKVFYVKFFVHEQLLKPELFNVPNASVWFNVTRGITESVPHDILPPSRPRRQFPRRYRV